MPHYLLSVCYPAGATPPSPERLDEIMADLAELSAGMRAAGAWVFGGGLHDQSSSTVVVDHDGRIAMTDGPFVETKEQVGGITVIDAADLDDALAWAGRQAAAIGVPIEVRPFQGGSG